MATEKVVVSLDAEMIAQARALHPDPPAFEGATPNPADDYLVALTLATKVDAVVSGDRHLHEADITVLTPRELADRLPS